MADDDPVLGSRIARTPFQEASRMKQLSGEIRDRLATRPKFQDVLSQPDIADAAEAQEVDEDGRQGSPGYFARREPENGEDESPADQDGKGLQIDFEV